MNKYVLCNKNTFASVVLQSLLAFLTINCKHYLNAVVSIVTAKSTTFEVTLIDNIAPSLTVTCNCSNKLKACANLTIYIALQTVY